MRHPFLTAVDQIQKSENMLWHNWTVCPMSSLLTWSTMTLTLIPYFNNIWDHQLIQQPQQIAQQHYPPQPPIVDIDSHDDDSDDKEEEDLESFFSGIEQLQQTESLMA